MRPAILLLLLLAGAARAADPALLAEARLVPGALEVVVVNPRGAAVDGVLPEVVYQHRTLRGVPARLDARGRHTWEIDLPPALRPGAAAAVVRVRADDASAALAAPVVVALVATPGTAPATVRVSLESEPVTRTGRADIRLANPGAAAVDGRVVVVLPDGLATEPQTHPARVPAAGSVVVPISIENRAALPPGTYAFYALFEYPEGDAQQTAIAKGLLTIAAPPGSGWRPLVIGVVATLATIALLGLALRRSARGGAGALGLLLLASAAADAAAPATPIRLVFDEGDLAGFSDISDPATGRPLGLVEYTQTRRDDVLSVLRVARFDDGSSDEDCAEARVADGLEAIRGRSIVRDPDGTPVAEVHIDVRGGRIHGSWGRGDGRTELDEPIALPPRTYWGPLIFLVLKDFAANAEDGRVAFRTVALTPRPRVFDMEIVRADESRLERAGIALPVVRYSLAPTVHWLLDPVIQRFLPDSSFWMRSGEPPLLVRFEGPRNYARQRVRIQ
jgi:hypothetical protein